VNRRQDRLLPAVLIGISLVWSIPQGVGPIDLRSDGAIYYILGTSLAQGQGYRLLNEPGDIRAVQYPPLLPLIVAVHQKALGTTDFVVVGRWLRAFYLCVLVALMAAVYRLARHFLPPYRAFLAGIICALALHIWYLAGVLYTEIPLALITVVFILCARRAERRVFWLATAALGVAAYLLRTAGIALLIAWVVEALIRRSASGKRDGQASLGPRLREAAARSVAALLPLIAWQAYIASVASSPEYRHPAYQYQRAAYQYSNVTYPENISLVSPFRPEIGGTVPPPLPPLPGMIAHRPSIAIGAPLAVRTWPLYAHVPVDRGWYALIRPLPKFPTRRRVNGRPGRFAGTRAGMRTPLGSTVRLLHPHCWATFTRSASEHT